MGKELGGDLTRPRPQVHREVWPPRLAGCPVSCPLNRRIAAAEPEPACLSPYTTNTRQGHCGATLIREAVCDHEGRATFPPRLCRERAQGLVFAPPAHGDSRQRRPSKHSVSVTTGRTQTRPALAQLSTFKAEIFTFHMLNSPSGTRSVFLSRLCLRTARP